MGSLYLGGRTIQEVDGEMMMGLSIYGVAVMDGSLYSRFYGLYSGNMYVTCLLLVVFVSQGAPPKYFTLYSSLMFTCYGWILIMNI